MSAPLLKVENLSVHIPDRHGGGAILDDISFQVAEAEVLALVGESGCGKSMTALSIMRLLPKPLLMGPGTAITFEDRRVDRLEVTEMRGMRGANISMIFQEPMTSLNPVQTVGDQVSEALRLHERISSRAARERVVEVFKKTGIPDPERRYDAYPHQLSGGLKQRIMISMALILRPKLLIADEPTTALDVTVQAQILALLRELQSDYGTSIVLITHDLGVVNELADRVAVMYAGRIIEEATRIELLKDARHPYTRGLLRAIPGRMAKGQVLEEISGMVPGPADQVAGCRFADRCTEAFDLCRVRQPQLVDASSTHAAACHLLERQ